MTGTLKSSKNTGFARNFLEELVVNQLSWLQLYTNWIDLPGYVKKGRLAVFPR